jgi:hypothetical protein
LADSYLKGISGTYLGLILGSLKEEFGLTTQTLPSKTPSPPPSAAEAQGRGKLAFLSKSQFSPPLKPLC